MNKILLKRYPFYRLPSNADGSWYDNIPEGWQKAFGMSMSEELRKALRETGELKTFKILDVKEKWGMLRIYHNGGPVIDDIIEKYESLSAGYCPNCGKPARYRTRGWISYLCESCFEESKDHNVKDICRLTKKDIPISDTDALKYNIDFTKLWDLK